MAKYVDLKFVLSNVIWKKKLSTANDYNICMCSAYKVIDRTY